MDIACLDFDAKEFVSASFTVKNEGAQLITLTGAPDFFLILWDIENLKILSKINIGLAGFSSNYLSGNRNSD